jgi:TolB-like protein
MYDIIKIKMHEIPKENTGMGKIQKIIIVFIITVLGCTTGSRSIDVVSVIDVNVPESKKIVISVMKFEDRSIQTKDFAPWSMGIPEMIMETLGAIPYYKVISREYIQKLIIKEQEFQLLGVTDEKTAVKLGNILNTKYIVLGSYQVFKNTLSINAKVLSVETGQVIVQSSVNGVVDEFYKHQNTLAMKLTKGMNIYVSPEVEKRLLEQYEKQETKVVQASLHNYKGEQKIEEIAVLKGKGEKENLKKKEEEAKQDFKKAISIDSGYEKAKSNLSKLALGAPMTL